MQEIQKVHPMDTQMISGLEKWILKQCRLVFKNEDESKKPTASVHNNEIQDNDARKRFKINPNKTKTSARRKGKTPHSTIFNIQGGRNL